MPAALAAHAQSSSEIDGNRSCSSCPMRSDSPASVRLAATIASAERLRSRTGETIDVSSHSRGCAAKAATIAVAVAAMSPTRHGHERRVEAVAQLADLLDPHVEQDLFAALEIAVDVRLGDARAPRQLGQAELDRADFAHQATRPMVACHAIRPPVVAAQPSAGASGVEQLHR